MTPATIPLRIRVAMEEGIMGREHDTNAPMEWTVGGLAEAFDRRRKYSPDHDPDGPGAPVEAWLAGVEVPSLADVVTLADVLDVNPEWLLGSDIVPRSKRDTYNRGAGTTAATVTLDGADARALEDRVIERICDRLYERFHGKVEEVVEKELPRRVDTLADEYLRARVEALVEDALTTGFQTYSSWGEPQGKPRTLKQILHEQLTARGRDGYSGPEGTLVERKLYEAINRKLDSDLADELKDAKKRFRAAIDGVLQSKVVDTLRTALGLPS